MRFQSDYTKWDAQTEPYNQFSILCPNPAVETLILTLPGAMLHQHLSWILF